MYFYLNSENQKIGPFLIDDLKKLSIDETTPIYEDTWADWKVAIEVEELKDLFHSKLQKWHINNGENIIGPITIEEVITRKVSRETLLWVEGSEKWIAAGLIPELREYFATVPPPLPKKSILETLFSTSSDTSPTTQPKQKQETVKERRTPNKSEIQTKSETPKFNMNSINFFKQYKRQIVIGLFVLIPIIVSVFLFSWRGSNTGDKVIAESAAKDFCNCIEKYDDMPLVGGPTAVFLCAAPKSKILKFYSRLKELDKESGFLNSIDLYILKSNFTSTLESKCKDKGKEYVQLIEDEAKSKGDKE